MASAVPPHRLSAPVIDHNLARSLGPQSPLRVRVLRKSRLKFAAPLAVMAGLMIVVVAAMVPGDPVGSEFRVNDYYADNQWYPSAAMSDSGDFVVVWSSWVPSWNAFGVYAQMFDSSGAKVGSEFLVYDNSSDNQVNPAVAMDADGDFIVTFQTTKDYQPSSYNYNGGIRQFFFNSHGNLVDQITGDDGDDPDEYDPSVSVSPDGSKWATVWTEANLSGGIEEVYGWGFPGLVANTSLNTYTDSSQAYPSVSVDSSGGSVVVWVSDGQDGTQGGIFGQRFDADGNATGPEFQANTYASGIQTQPSVASTADGGFIVAWSSNGQDGSGYGVYAQRFSNSGQKEGLEFRANTQVDYHQWLPSVAASSEGGFVIVWVSLDIDTGSYEVMGQRYLSDGTAMGSEFMVNTYTEADQTGPSIAMGAGGRFIVVWQSNGQDLNGWEVYGQLYTDAPIPEFQHALVPIVGTAALLLAVSRRRGR